MGAAAIPVVAGAGAYQAFAQGQQAKAASKYYGYLASTVRTNARLAETAGEAQSREIGEAAFEGSRRIGQKVRATVGAQKAAFAAGTVGVTSKTAEQLVADTMKKGSLDETALRYNAALKMKAVMTGAEFTALGERSQAAGYDIAGRNVLNAGRLNQISTILGTGASVASIWQRRKLTGYMD